MLATQTQPGGIYSSELPWGTHFCQFYRTREDLMDSLVPYMKSGLERNERCLWLTAAPFGTDDARSVLGSVVPSLETALKSGRIKIIDHSQWYTPGGAFDRDAVIRELLQSTERAKADGYEGLRATGNLSWIHRSDWGRFADYESRLTEVFRGKPIMGLCSYSIEQCDASQVLDVVRSHEHALVRTHGDWEIIESASLKIAKEDLARLNEDLEQRIANRTAQLKQALEARDDFLSLASHELRTPITALLLQVDGLLRAFSRGMASESDVARRLEKIREQGLRLDGLVENLLGVSRATSKEMSIEPERLDLTELVKHVLLRKAADLDVARCKLCFCGPSPVPGCWDRERLEQVVTILLDNVVKHAPLAPVTVTVGEAENTACITIEDGGPGIAAEDWSRIFDRFVRLSSARRQGGFGLGLWLAKRIVTAHGGTIEVRSQPGKGATFTVTLPRIGTSPP